MNPGDTFFGLDKRGHLWMVLTAEDAVGQVAVANLTTHDAARPRCDERCVIVRPGEHPYPSHDSCVSRWHAFLASNELLRRGVEDGIFEMNAPFSPRLLQRIRRELRDAPLTPRHVRDAIRRDS